MNLIIKYPLKEFPAVAQMPNNATDLGITGVNFIGAKVNLAMALANPAAISANELGSYTTTKNINVSDGTYVDKIVSILVPTLTSGNTNYLSTTLDKIGVNNDIIGVEILGTNRVEDANTAAFAKHILLDPNIGFSVSKSRLIITIGNAINAIGGSTLNLRITYKN